MDRSKVTKPTAQIGFIKYVLIPLYETLCEVRDIVGRIVDVLLVKYSFMVHKIICNNKCNG